MAFTPTPALYEHYTVPIEKHPKFLACCFLRQGKIKIIFYCLINTNQFHIFIQHMITTKCQRGKPLFNRRSLHQIQAQGGPHLPSLEEAADNLFHLFLFVSHQLHIIYTGYISPALPIIKMPKHSSNVTHLPVCVN